jgi:V/A-type H+-transporting ATPase subunit E
MGLDKVVKDISERSEAEAREIGARAAAEAASIKKSAEAEAGQIYASEMAKADVDISRMRQREQSSAKLDVKKSKLNAEKDVLVDVRADFAKGLSTLSAEKRAGTIRKLVALARKEITAGKIFTNAADAGLVAGSGYEYGGNIDCLGGILVTSADGTVNLDYTFESIMEDVWSESTRSISDMLFRSG